MLQAVHLLYVMAYEQIQNYRISRFRYYYINTSTAVLELIWGRLGYCVESHALCLNKLSLSLRWSVIINQVASPRFFHCQWKMAATSPWGNNNWFIFTFYTKRFKFFQRETLDWRRYLHGAWSLIMIPLSCQERLCVCCARLVVHVFSRSVLFQTAGPVERVDLCVRLPSVSFAVCALLIKASFLPIRHSAPSFHCPGFMVLERQTGGRCRCSLQ